MKKKVFFVLIVFILIVLVVVLVIKSDSTTPSSTTPSPAPYTLNTVNRWEDISPGTSTVQEVTSRLGSPASSQNTEAGVVYQYPSKNQYWKNEVTVKDNVVSFIAERIFPPAETSLKKLTQKFTGQPTRLYGPDFEGGVYLFVFPSSGIAYVANGSQGTVYQIWYFPPTTLSSFLQLPQAKDYGLQPKREPEGI